jgi:hypothetical protein
VCFFVLSRAHLSPGLWFQVAPVSILSSQVFVSSDAGPVRRSDLVGSCFKVPSAAEFSARARQIWNSLLGSGLSLGPAAAVLIFLAAAVSGFSC